MDKYFLFVITLIIFSVLIILAVQISTRIPKISDSKDDSDMKEGDNDSDFTLLE